MNEIRPTTMKYEYNNAIGDYVRIYNNIFPIKLEIEYVELAYLVNSYIATCNRLRRANDKSAASALANTKPIEELDSIDQDMNAIIPRINELSGSISKNTKIDIINELNDLTRRLSIVAHRKATLTRQIDSNNQSYYEQEENIGLIRAKLADIVLSIKEQLKNISMLDIDGKKRIDSLEVKPTHLDMVDSFSMLSADKDALKDRLGKYLEFRVLLFKKIEEFARDIVPAYGKHEIFDGEYDDVTPAFFALAGNDITETVITPYFSVDYAEEKDMYRFINGYFKTGQCDIELGKELLNGTGSWALKQAILDIVNHNKKLSNDNHVQKR